MPPWMLAASALIALTVCAVCAAAVTEVEEIDLSRAVLLTPPGLSVREETTVDFMLDEVEKRTRIRWDRVTRAPADGRPVVALGRAPRLAEFAGRHAAEVSAEANPGREGYRIRVFDEGGAPQVVVAGSDERGLLFGAGRLLRNLAMSRDRVLVSRGLRIASAPRVALRGHQLGYRPKTNSYDAWDLPTWEQYFRDLAVFGCNAVELIPPRSDDDADSPHFPVPPMRMMEQMSATLDRYDMDVWIWYPALDEDYSKPETVQFALKEWDEVFSRLKRIDAVFVPGGDPGHTQPKYLMPLLEKQAASLRKRHPQAQMWVAPQGFSQEWMDEFLEILKREPRWLTGVVFGPQVRLPLSTLRKLVPSRYPIRHYPDITHSRQCQYPVPGWDTAFAVTEAREGINPRPLQMERIFEWTNPDTVGFITYSEGCNDDVNKCVWSALGWDPETDVRQTLREYSRYFIGEEFAHDFAEGLLALERNWQGPLAANEGVAATLRQFQAMEQTARPQVKLNWRFQQALYRATYDAFVQARVRYETELESRAMETLAAAPTVGAGTAMDQAQAILDRSVREPVAAALRARVFELAEALFQSIRMQLSVGRYQAINVGRGANLDTIDMPLNSRPWLLARFAEIRKLTDEAARLVEIRKLVEWTNPGPGGFYDDLGNLTAQPHLVRGKGSRLDPAYWESALTGFSQPPGGRWSWWNNAEALHDNTLQLRYDGLDPKARYRVRVVYAGDTDRWKIRLDAGDAAASRPVHDLMARPAPVQPVEFGLPAGSVTAKGELLLTWSCEKGRPGNGRGCQVAEVWLLREAPSRR